MIRKRIKILMNIKSFKLMFIRKTDKIIHFFYKINAFFKEWNLRKVFKCYREFQKSFISPLKFRQLKNQKFLIDFYFKWIRIFRKEISNVHS